MDRFISVIIPAYNAAPYVADAIESVLSQTYRNFEIVVVDDGSSDNTRSVVASYADAGKVHYVYQQNKGPAAARNNGISLSKGELVAFLDADDLWLPNKLERQIACFDDEAVGLSYTDRYLLVDGADREESSIDYRDGNVLRALIRGNFITNSSVIIRRSILQKAGLFNESKIFFAVEDYDLWLRAAAFSLFRFVPERLVRYRIHESQISANPIFTLRRLVSIYRRYSFSNLFGSYRFLFLYMYARVLVGILKFRILN